VSYRIVLAVAAHTVSETVIKPCAVEMPTCVLGEHSYKKQGETVQLSERSVKRRIQVLSLNTEKQLVSRPKSSFAC
jgi:hypothetical protein